MEAIQRYELAIELSQCQSLYDYVHRKEHKRMDAGWDFAKIREDASLRDYQSNTAKYKEMITRMEESFRDARLLEKEPYRFAIDKESKEISIGKTDESAINDRMNILFRNDAMFGRASSQDGAVVLPSWVLPIYKPGDCIRGKLILELTNPLSAERLKLEFLGRAATNVRVQHKDGHHDDRGREEYVRATVFYWQKAGLKNKYGESSSQSLPESEKLPPGLHQFYFDFRIPEDIPPSIPSLVPSGPNQAFLTYFLKATVDKGNLLSRGNVVIFRGLWIEKPVDLACDPDNMKPIIVKKDYRTGLCGSSGCISYKVKLNGKGAIKNKPFMFQVELENQTSEMIKDVIGRVDLMGKYMPKDRWWKPKRKFCAKGDEIRQGTVASGMAPQFNFEVAVDFMAGSVDGYLAPAGNLFACSIIKSYYIAYVEVKRGLFKRNIRVKVPINLGTHNSSRSDPVY